MTFAWNRDAYETRWVPEPTHQGWAGRVHGGMIGLVLDETLSRAALSLHGHEWVTAELTTRLHRPADPGTPLLVRARVETVRRALIVCRGEVREEGSGLLVATGQAKLMRVK